MSLTAADVAQIMRLVEQSSFDELTLEIDGTKLSLRRGAPGDDAGSGRATQVVEVTGRSDEAGSPAVVDAAAAATTLTTEAHAPLDPGVQEVASPLLGTYYRAAKPGAVPYVDVGTHTEVDTIVGIIEVMKLMNAVRAGVRGTVTEVLVADGALAEYGQPLLRIRKAG